MGPGDGVEVVEQGGDAARVGLVHDRAGRPSLFLFPSYPRRPIRAVFDRVDAPGTLTPTPTRPHRGGGSKMGVLTQALPLDGGGFGRG